MNSELLNLKRNSPVTFVAEITPEIASALLATSPFNRNIVDSRVRAYSGAIERGEWRVTNQGIGFNCNGELRDGHHRLTAVISTGKTITTNVTLGLSDGVYTAIDQGLPRSTQDVFGGSKQMAQAINLAASIVVGSGVASKDQIAVIYKTKLADLSERILEFTKFRNKKVVSSATVRLTACLCVCDGESEEFVFGQYKALLLSDYDSMTPASKIFNRQIEDGKASISRSRPDVMKRSRSVFQKESQGNKRVVIRGTEDILQWAREIIQNEIKGVKA